ncbi:MAG TPA: acetyl-CoA carboxylase biotin carboxyl carrier protein [Candidatus Dorea intestinavium]|nr:acetyl-CoA carboxylase biotin carboxyl carrier protein [Candidatus Dorea intestinavium]
MNFENLLELIKTVSESKLTTLEYKDDEVRLKLSKEKEIQIRELALPIEEENSTPTCETKSPIETGKIIKSPLVGTFYVAPAEDAMPYVKVGDTIKSGQVLGIVEAMKLMNEIESECDGVIEEILVKNGEAVEYGQALFRIK